jgi:malonyl CoA-acyl carrier protein transacylase
MTSRATALTAVLFPGQGSQTVDMRDEVVALRPDLLELATAVCGVDPFEHVDEGTRYQQPAIFCASLAGWERARTAEPDYLAGHSLGEIAALVAAGALGVEDALRLVDVRARATAAAGSERTGMLAARADLQTAADIAAATGATVANENAPRQVVLAGGVEALDRAEAELRARKLRAVRLAVTAAFHSPAMEPAVPAVDAALATIDFAAPRIPVLSCISAAPFEDPRRELAAALTQRVRWVAVLERLDRDGVRRFVEAGPGSVLTGLVRRTLPDAEAVPPESLEAAHA